MTTQENVLHNNKVTEARQRIIHLKLQSLCLMPCCTQNHALEWLCLPFFSQIGVNYFVTSAVSLTFDWQITLDAFTKKLHAQFVE